MTALIREALSGYLLHSGSHEVKPDVWVSSWRTVTASLPLARELREVCRDRAVEVERPSSTSWTTAIEVKSLDTEARSKMVSSRIGTHCVARAARCVASA